MRRIDRILFSALGHKINESTEFLDESGLEEISAAETVLESVNDDVVPTDIPETSSGLETDASKDITCKDDGFQDNSISLRSSATPAVTKVADITKSDVESPAAPPYSPLTPLVTLRKTIAETCLDSPAAPAYSPLTPLATRKEAEKNNSPIPPMSPSTLELFETLSQDLSTVDHAYIDLKED